MSEMPPYNQLGWSDLKLPLGQCPGCSEKCSTIGMLGRRRRWREPDEEHLPAQCEKEGTASFVQNTDTFWYSVLRSLAPIPNFEAAYKQYLENSSEVEVANQHEFVKWLAANKYIELVDES